MGPRTHHCHYNCAHWPVVVALALSATVIGLTIAIPSLVGSGYLQRKIENYAAQLDVLLERILKRGRP